jgi:hypothetical protein
MSLSVPEIDRRNPASEQEHSDTGSG